MNVKRHILLPIVALTALAWLFWPEQFSVNPPLRITSGSVATATTLHVPEPFKIEIFASELRGVRMLQTTPRGDLIASLPREGRVLLLRRDQDGDGQSDEQVTLLDGLNQPHGVALHNGWLYIAETDAVIRVSFDDNQGKVVSAPQTVVRDHFPGGGGHWTRTVGIGPDDHLYVTVGSSCNVCIEEHPTRATMLRYRLDGSNAQIHAQGLRNTVGFDWHPTTGALYGTDNGRDWLGDDFPPCELNRIEPGQHYGWPFINGDNVQDPDYGDHADRASNPQPPVYAFDAHTAPLGMRFLTAKSTPAPYQRAALVALHGSWNRSTKVGYRVVSLHFNDDGQIEEREFLTGFLKGESVSGRPVDIVQHTSGDIFISDDFSGQIYRVFVPQ